MTETTGATGVGTGKPELAFLQAQVLLRIGPEMMDAADEGRAGLHVEADGKSGLHLPAVYAGDAALDGRIRRRVADWLRDVADALEAHAAAGASPIVATE